MEKQLPDFEMSDMQLLANAKRTPTKILLDFVHDTILMMTLPFVGIERAKPAGCVQVCAGRHLNPLLDLFGVRGHWWWHLPQTGR